MPDRPRIDMHYLSLLPALLLGFFASTGVAAQEFDLSHKAWTRVLKQHGESGHIDYAGLAKDRNALDTYLGTLEAVDAKRFAAWSREDRYAFWVNAYNAYTVKVIVDHYPVKSIMKIGEEGKIWDRPFIDLKPLFPKAQGEQLSLNDIEHKILRPEFKDARVHAAVNCASLGCPPLQLEAFQGDKLDQQLDRAVRSWLADKRLNRFDGDAKRVQASKIFEWFAEDFGKDKASLGKWLAKYAPREHKTWLASGAFELSYLEYDWKLNDLRRPKPKKD